MAKQTSGPAPTDADLLPVEHLCRACGDAGAVAVLAYPGDGGPSLALCAGCARDLRALRALVATLRAHRLVVVPAPSASDAA